VMRRDFDDDDDFDDDFDDDDETSMMMRMRTSTTMRRRVRLRDDVEYDYLEMTCVPPLKKWLPPWTAPFIDKPHRRGGESGRAPLFRS